MFRVIDIMRHQTLYKANEASDDGIIAAIIVWHRVLAWVPGRLLMAGYALAGNYEQAVAAWRDRGQINAAEHLVDEQLLGAVGCAAACHEADSDVSTRAQVAIDLVFRTLWFIWCPVLALLTLYGSLN